MASARRSRYSGASAVPPGCITRFRCCVISSMISTARVLPSISSPALMPRISSGQLSKPAASSVPLTFCATYSLMRARLTTHSRSTAPCTCWKSWSAASPSARLAFLRGRIRPTSCVVEMVLDA